MVDPRDDIEVESFVWDYGPDGNILHLARHQVSMVDVYSVLARGPLYYRNLPGRRASHVMIGRDLNGRSLYIALVSTREAGEGMPVTGWQSALAHRLLEQEGVI